MTRAAARPPIVDIGAFEASADAFILVTPNPVSVPEDGTANVEVRLAWNPDQAIEVETRHSSGDPDITVSSGDLLSFDSNNFFVHQVVELAAAADIDNVHGTAEFELKVADMPELPVTLLTAHESDDDLPRGSFC